MAVQEQALSLRYAALSDLGRYRKDNQDSGFASEHLLVVADGVGGAAYGDVASHTAVQIIRRLDGPAPDDALQALAGTIHRVHDRLAELVDHDPELDGTSTTVTAGLFDRNRIAIAHLGDSRAYLLRGNRIERLTTDHTFVQTLIDEGRISEDEARTHPHRNLILRAVDGVHDTEPDLFFVELEPGDRLLFCSDGCSGVLPDEQLARLLGHGHVDFAAGELVKAALDAGTTDNVTVVVAEVVPDGTPADPEAVAASAGGPLLVGAAAGQPRKLVAGKERHLFRRGTSSDTGELDPVTGEPLDEEELRYAPRPPRGGRWARRVGILAALLLVLAVAGKVAYDWSQRQYYVGADGDDVVIYQGVEIDLPLLDMHHIAESTVVTLASLPEFDAQQVRDGISAESLDDARRIVSENLLDHATKCPQPKKKHTARKSGSTASPKPTSSPSPSPSPTIAPPECIEPSDLETP